MRGRFQSRGAVCAVLAVGLLAAPALAQQTAKPKPGATPLPPPLMIMPIRPEDAPRPPVIAPAPPRPGPPPAPGRPSVIANPSWARSPQPEYPELAVIHGITEGRVTVRCLTLPNGTLTDCQVIEETPPGHGFAEATIAAALRARLSPRTVDGAAVGARVQFTTRYVMPEPLTSVVLRDPQWAVHPRPVMPRNARRARIETAQVRLACEIVPGSGRMRDCRVIEDGPEGYGFGEAAIQAVRGAAITGEWLARAAPDARAIFTITFRR
ncbi:MAG: energy transducer TonB [Brevundimonas sp.]|nr:energy transducer TonB [Brevundimonas sp.]